MKKELKRLLIDLGISALVLMFVCYIIGADIGEEKAYREVRTQLHATQHAPGIVTIGDSTYIVRYYSLNY